jgi:hypothetical protein
MECQTARLTYTPNKEQANAPVDLTPKTIYDYNMYIFFILVICHMQSKAMTWK